MKTHTLLLLALGTSCLTASAFATAGEARGETQAGVAACNPGPGVFCGPAKATIFVNGKRYALANGRCDRYRTYFLVNIGTAVTSGAAKRPKRLYFGLIMGRSPAYPDPVVNKPGVYRKGLITMRLGGPQVDLHNEPDLRIVLGAGLRSGTFSATKAGSPFYGTPTYKVKGSFTC